jgi:hypothetical protein
LIKRLEIENYGCIRHAEVKPTPLHALFGPSDVGKSTVLKAIAALSQFIRVDQHREPAPLIPLKARDTLTLTVEFAGSLGFNVGFAPRSQTLETYVRESMQGEWLGYRHVTPDFRWASEEPAEVAEFARQIRARLECAVIHLQNSALHRDSPLLTDNTPVMLEEEGHGLAGVYDRIMARGDESFDLITQRIKSWFPWVGGIEVSTVSQVTKNLFIRSLDGQRIPAKHVGVGLLRMLAWESLRYADRPRTLLVEEPEAGLSPALTSVVMQLLRELTIDPQRPTQVLIATRSPLVVAELDPMEITLVTRNTREGTRVAALADHPDYAIPAQRLPRGVRWLDLADGIMGAPTTTTVRTRA